MTTSSLAPFSPTGANVQLALSTTSGGAALPGVEGDQVRVILGTTGAVAFLAFGYGAVPTATSADLPMLGNTFRIFSLPAGVTHFAAVAFSGTPTLHIQRGSGS